VEDIFRIERQGELERFEKSDYSKVKTNRRLLWHGSRVTNFGGILGQGLRIAPPEAPVTGYMFGKGIYLADMSSKSANYCNAHTSGGTALLLLCEAELGDPMHELTGSSYTAGEDAKAKGMFSTWGMGSTGPSKWKDAKCVNSSLAGCMMVSNCSRHLTESQLITPSPICRLCQAPPKCLVPISNIMSTSHTMLLKSASGTFSVFACSTKMTTRVHCAWQKRACFAPHT
jgi:hypothetical protein